MRKTYSQLLSSMGFSASDEYWKLLQLYQLGPLSTSYCIDAPRNTLEHYFLSYRYRSTCTSLDEFEFSLGVGNGARFDSEQPDIDDLITLAEHLENLILGIFTKERLENGSHPELAILLDQIDKILDSIGYIKQQDKDGVWVFVENNSAVVAASELLDGDLAVDAFMYTHHSINGDLGTKRSILQEITNYLEPFRNTLKSYNKALEDNIFFLFNNTHIRHNNLEKESPHYSPGLATLSNAELESLYDVLYRMCLTAILTLDCVDEAEQVIKPLKAAPEKKEHLSSGEQ